MSKKTKAQSSPNASQATQTKPAPRKAPKRKSRGSHGTQKASRDSQPQEVWQVKHPNAAGIDIGSREHWVSVGRGRGEPRPFGPCTPDLDRMVEWLRSHGIEHVAMESTGMYWLPVYERLEEEGFAVILVDARQTKHTAGRKSDLSDCEWIAQLHTYGLLRAAFRPTDSVCRVRTMQRHRKGLVEGASSCIQLMQKAFDGMNLHIHQVLSDITGLSGMAMIESILKGERDPEKLAGMASSRVKKTKAQLIAALTGNYREEELFILAQAKASYEHFQQLIAECDAKIATQLEALCALCPEKPAQDASEQGQPAPAAKPGARGAVAGGRLARERSLAPLLARLFGVDLTAIPGLAALAVLTLLSEIGTDMSRWRHAKAFASWLGLCPNHRISGGRVLSRGSRKVVNRAATILRVAAMAVRATDTPLGAFYRRKAGKLGAPKAITATARKMACLIYEMIRTGQEYRAMDASVYQKRYDAQRLAQLRKRAKALGYNLVELSQAA